MISDIYNIMQQIENSWHRQAPCSEQAFMAIEQIYALPADYKKFMMWSNGGEGQIGNSYISLWRIEYILSLNNDYNIQKYLGGETLAIGTDGGESCYGFDFTKGFDMFCQPLGDLDSLAPGRIVAKSFYEWMQGLLDA